MTKLLQMKVWLVKINTICVILLSLSFFGCMDRDTQKVSVDIDKNEVINGSFVYEVRDENYMNLAYKVAKFFIEKKKHWTLNRVEDIQDIYSVQMSPDSSKILILVINKLKNGKGYSGNQYIGWRESTDSSWRFIFWSGILPTNYAKVNDVKNVLYNYFNSEKFTKNGTYIKRNKNSEVVMELFKYHINHEKFWEGVLWKKNYLVDSMYLYPFQMEANGKDGYNKKEGVLFNDSILNTL